jgi:hypothetical protein
MVTGRRICRKLLIYIIPAVSYPQPCHPVSRIPYPFHVHHTLMGGQVRPLSCEISAHKLPHFAICRNAAHSEHYMQGDANSIPLPVFFPSLPSTGSFCLVSAGRFHIHSIGEKISLYV